MEFKGTKGKLKVVYNDLGHITSVRTEDNSRVLFTSKINNMIESNANMKLASVAPDMLDVLYMAKSEFGEYHFMYKIINDLILKATEI
jgi:hypothetical protein